MSRSWLRCVLALLAAFLYGYATGRLPSPADPSVFWIGNLGAPYVVVGFVAGAWAVRRPLAAAGIGAAAAVTAVCGFYDVLGLWSADPVRWGLPAGTDAWTVRRTGFGHWFSLLTTGNPPWLTIAVVAGAAAGFLGHRFARRYNRSAGWLLAALLVVEPLVYATGLDERIGFGWRYRLDARNLTVWVAEAVLGLVFAAFVATRRGLSVAPVSPAPTADESVAA